MMHDTVGNRKDGMGFSCIEAKDTSITAPGRFRSYGKFGLGAPLGDFAGNDRWVAVDVFGWVDGGFFERCGIEV